MAHETDGRTLEAGYEAYLERAERVLGALAVGGYGKFNGVMVKKLTFDEYALREKEYVALRAHLERLAAADHTINTTLLKTLREKAAELILDPVE